MKPLFPYLFNTTQLKEFLLEVPLMNPIVDSIPIYDYS